MASDPLVPESYASRFIAHNNYGGDEWLIFDITPTGLPDSSPNYPDYYIDPTLLVPDATKRIMEIALNNLPGGYSFEVYWAHKPDAQFIERIINGYRHLNHFNQFGIKVWEA